jgi:hypothetical protein
VARLLWLPEVLREWGLTVELIPGWASRGQEFPRGPRVVVGHHTATNARAQGDLPTRSLLVQGRSPGNPAAPDHLPGPLCQVGLGRSGRAYVIASGKANHAGKGAWQGFTVSSTTVGVEVEHPGSGPWPAVQLDAFDRVVAALLYGLGAPAEHYCGHREWALPVGRKPDPAGVNLNAQRARVAGLLSARHRRAWTPPTPPRAPVVPALLLNPPPAPVPTVVPPSWLEPTVPYLVKDPNGPAQFVVREDLSARVHVTSTTDRGKLVAAAGDRLRLLELTAAQLAAIPDVTVRAS